MNLFLKVIDLFLLFFDGLNQNSNQTIVVDRFNSLILIDQFIQTGLKNIRDGDFNRQAITAHQRKGMKWGGVAETDL